MDGLKDLEELRKQGLSDPKEILRFLQKELVQGSDLDVTSESEGETELYLHRQT